jgi:hypothetical protein
VGESKDFRIAIAFAGGALLLACAAFAFLVTVKGVDDFRALIGQD